MPKQFLALEEDQAPRLELEWGGYMRDFHIRLDGEPIGRIDGGQRELKEGRDFSLPDGSTLTIKLAQTAMIDELQVLRNGKPLPGSAANPNQKLTAAVRAAFFWGMLEIIGAVVVQLTAQPFLRAMGFGSLSIALGAMLLVCAYYISRWSQAAAWVGTAVAAAALVYSGIVAYSAENSIMFLTALALLVRFLILPAIATAIPAIRQLQQ